MAFVVKVDATGYYTFHQALDRQLDVDALLYKGQHQGFGQYVQARHPLPEQMFQHLRRTLRFGSGLGRLIWTLCCLCCCDQGSWDNDRDPDLLRQHITTELAGILALEQFEVTEHIQVNTTWQEGRGVLKLWLKDPNRHEA